MSNHLYTHINPVNEKHIEKAVAVLKNGGIIAYPTDVNWAVGCDPAQAKALKKILKIKPSHPKQQPFTLLCDNISMVSQVASLNGSAYKILKRILPGAYTVLLKSNETLMRKIKDKRQVVGVRVPQSPLLLELINYYGKPLATSSLGVEDGFSFGYQIEEKYGHGFDLLLDLGEELIPLETSILDLTEGEPIVIRKGVGPVEMFE